jgi:hypothetical protein
MSAYGSSTVKRQRCTRAQLDAIAEAVAADSPATVHGVFCCVVSEGWWRRWNRLRCCRALARQAASRRKHAIPYSGWCPSRILCGANLGEDAGTVVTGD